MPAAKPARQECPRKRELAQSIRLIIDKIIALNRDIQECVVRGDTGKMDDLRAELAQARTNKDVLLENYKEHARVHGC